MGSREKKKERILSLMRSLFGCQSYLPAHACVGIIFPQRWREDEWRSGRSGRSGREERCQQCERTFSARRRSGSGSGAFLCVSLCTDAGWKTECGKGCDVSGKKCSRWILSFPRPSVASFDRHLRHDKHISRQRNMIYLMAARKTTTVSSLILVSASAPLR